MKIIRALQAALLAFALAGCVSLTTDPRALIAGPEGVEVRTLPCDAAIGVASKWFPATPAGPALDPARIRVLTWNIHKQGDSGWEADLSRFAEANDIVLLQEATLIDPLTDILRKAGLHWVMASSFIYKDTDIGVVTAARADRRALHAARNGAASSAAEILGRHLAAGARLEQAARGC